MTTAVENTHSGQPAQSRRKTVFGTGIGNALEWFDWGIFAIFSPFFATQFFNPDNPVSAFLSTLIVFAVGFLARPLGGFVFGWVSDHRGRKFAMAATVGCAALGSTLIAISPTYGQIGIFASLILVAARLVQGLAHGGELPSAQTYVSEFAQKHNRGLWASLIYVSGTIGNVVGVLTGAILSTLLTQEQMTSYGWRIPFLIGGVVGLYALIMRARMTETDHFEQDLGHQPGKEKVTKKGPSVWSQIRSHKLSAVRVIGLTVGSTVAFYTWAIAAPAHAIASLGIDPEAALWVGVLANLIFIALLPAWGALSDKIGRKPVLLISALGLAAVSFPLNLYLQDSAFQLAVAMIVALIFMGGACAIVPAVYAEMFPTRIRTIGVGVPYSIAVAIFGGTAPYLQEWMALNIASWAFVGYTVVLLLITAGVVLTIPETKGKDLHES